MIAIIQSFQQDIFVPKMNMEVIRYYFYFQMTNNELIAQYISLM